MRRVAPLLLLALLLPARAIADPLDDDADVSSCHGKSPAFLPTISGCVLAMCDDEDDGDEPFQTSLGKDGVGEFSQREGHERIWEYGCKADEPAIAKKAEAALRVHGWKIVYAGAPDQTEEPKDKQRADLRTITASKGNVFVRVDAPDPDDEEDSTYSVTWIDGKEIPPCTHDCD